MCYLLKICLITNYYSNSNCYIILDVYVLNNAIKVFVVINIKFAL